ncbi:MAG: response regulator [Candidatus Eremiobacteraeota bacterium]|nr:response regulator [Candidatus Eremiobacteraeota bacterium]
MDILVVDDSKVQLKILTSLVKKNAFGNAHCFIASKEALKWAETHEVDLAIVDYNMPAPNGLEFIRLLRKMAGKELVPILMVTLASAKEIRYAALECGANDFLTKPLDIAEFSARVKNMSALSQLQNQLAETANWFAEQLKAATSDIANRERETILKLSVVAERRNPETSGHLSRMSHYCRCIAGAHGSSQADQDLLFTASPLHDIGKVAIPDSIQLKAGPLTREEFVIMKQHTTAGFDILNGSGSNLLQLAAIIALTHHEKYDGTGYPNGLKRHDIPLVGRICALSDVFDALTSARPYKNAWTIEDAVAEINRCSGTHFDPRLVDVFNSVLPRLLEIKNLYRAKEPMPALN